jgi:hypothetical protein
MGFNTKMRESKTVGKPNSKLRKAANDFLSGYGLRIFRTRKGTREQDDKGRYYLVNQHREVVQRNVDIRSKVKNLLV